MSSPKTALSIFYFSINLAQTIEKYNEDFSHKPAGVCYYYITATHNTKETQMTVYIVNYRGTMYGVFDSLDKARSSEYADLYGAEIIAWTVQ